MSELRRRILLQSGTEVDCWEGSFSLTNENLNSLTINTEKAISGIFAFANYINNSSGTTLWWVLNGSRGSYIVTSFYFPTITGNYSWGTAGMIYSDSSNPIIYMGDLAYSTQGGPTGIYTLNRSDSSCTFMINSSYSNTARFAARNGQGGVLWRYIYW